MSSNITSLIPSSLLTRFLREHVSCKLLLVSVSGPHAYGYAVKGSQLEVKGIHIEPTENLVGLHAAPKAFNWVGEFESQRIDYSSEEIGTALRKLLRGDGSILERVLAQRQMFRGEDLRRLQKVTRGVICRRFFAHYRSFSKGVVSEFGEGERRTVRQLLAAYRLGLTGVHLLRTGKVVLDLMTLASDYGFSRLEELVKTYQEKTDALVPSDSRWTNRLVRLHALLERALEESKLPNDPDHPAAVEEFLLDMRRRFFDAATVQQPRSSK